MTEKRFVYRCKYCGNEFTDESKCAVHEKYQCMLNPKLTGKGDSPFSFLKFLIFATLTVAAMALIVISPIILYPLLLGHPEPYNYIALAIFWVAILAIPVLAAMTDYLRKRHKTP
jgi:hypothetical protein